MRLSFSLASSFLMDPLAKSLRRALLIQSAGLVLSISCILSAFNSKKWPLGQNAAYKLHKSAGERTCSLLLAPELKIRCLPLVIRLTFAIFDSTIRLHFSLRKASPYCSSNLMPLLAASYITLCFSLNSLSLSSNVMMSTIVASKHKV